MLEKVTSLQMYYALVEKTKSRVQKKVLFTNCYLQNEQIERYIQLERFFYFEIEAGILFISDEETYYKVFYYLNLNSDFRMECLDKPILVRNLYVDDRKTERLLLFERQLINSGFQLHDTTFQMVVDKSQSDEIDKKARMFDRILKKGNFVLGKAKLEQLDEIFELRDSTAEFNKFTFPYMTDEENSTAVENGDYFCVCDENGNVCGTTWIEINNKIATGNGLCVKEDHKTMYGFGAALSLKALSDSFKRGVEKHYGWIIKTDAVSTKFHENVGFVRTGKAEDDWIL